MRKKTALTFPLVKRRTFSQCIVHTVKASCAFSSVLLTLSLKFNCKKTPQRLSEVSLCKLLLLQLYRRLVVKVEAHLKLSVLGSAWSSAPFSTPFSEGDDIIPLTAFKESAVHYLGPFLIPRDWICKNKHSWEPHNRSSHKSFVCDYLKQLIWFSSLLLPIK